MFNNIIIKLFISYMLRYTDTHIFVISFVSTVLTFIINHNGISTTIATFQINFPTNELIQRL